MVLNAMKSYFDSDGIFYNFMSNPSKTWFTTNAIKTLVHRTRNIRLCGRHQFSADCESMFFML